MFAISRDAPEKPIPAPKPSSWRCPVRLIVGDAAGLGLVEDSAIRTAAAVIPALRRIGQSPCWALDIGCAT
jgi:hypothetical protein